MKRSQKKQTATQGRILTLNNLLFAVCVTVIALRVTITEAPGAISTGLNTIVNETIYSLAVSFIIILALLIWFTYSVCKTKFTYRITYLEIPLILLIIASALSTYFAADKRAAITASVSFIAPACMAILLVQLLDSKQKIRILLIAIAALAMASAWQSTEQFAISNQVLADQYRADPGTILRPLGITSGSINHMMIEHRILSKDVKGFFTTSNSAGSFGILALFATLAMFINAYANRNTQTPPKRSMVFPVVALAAVILGLLITQSKGALAAAALGLFIFMALLYKGEFLRRHKKILIAASLILICAAAMAVTAYGIKHDTIPGGKSMFVRWQYWKSTTKLIADNPITGVGPGNFSDAYTKYKPSAAVESVSDPHCMPLSILAQYGPLGLIACLAIFLCPILRANTDNRNASLPDDRAGMDNLAAMILVIAALAMFAVKPLITPATTGSDMMARTYDMFVNYAIPAVAFLIGFWLLTAAISAPDKYSHQNTNITAAAIFSAIIAVLAHNLIDFAIFELGVLTNLFAMIAALIAISTSRRIERLPSAWPKIGSLIVAIAIIVLFFKFIFVPMHRVSVATAQANDAIPNVRYALAQYLLGEATKADPLSSEAPSQNAKIYLDDFRLSGYSGIELLKSAEEALFIAIDRNPNASKNFQLLTQTYLLFADAVPDQSHEYFLQALNSAQIAVELNPASARLRMPLAYIAEELNDNRTALAQYKKAVEIEDAFRGQFQKLYPDYHSFSRLGFDNYAIAKEKIEELSEKTVPIE